jgi:PPOX class probable F420-dependent enzyme
MARVMDDAELRRFLAHGTRTGKLAWVAASGQPQVAPIWFIVDDAAPDLEVVFTTGATTSKGRALRRDPRACLLVDDDAPPFAFAKLTGAVELSDDLPEVRSWATRIAARYMGVERAEEYGARNGVPGELLVRLRPTTVRAEAGIAD